MKNISYNDTDRTINIKDNLKSHNFVIKFLLVLNLLNASLRIADVKNSNINYEMVIWFILGIVSLILLYSFVVKRTAVNKIPINNITSLKEGTFFGTQRISMILANGKDRNLPEIKSKEEFDELREILFSHGIASTN
jgi:hypothetical protein